MCRLVISHGLLCGVEYGTDNSAHNHTFEPADMAVNLDSYERISAYFNLIVGSSGLILNLFGVLLAMKIDWRSTGMFVILMSLTDSVVIGMEATSGISYFLDDTTKEELLFGSSALRCRLGLFFSELCRIVSSWLVVAMIAEVLLITHNPRRGLRIHRKSRAAAVCLYIAMIAMAGTLPFLVLTSADDEGCSSQYETFTGLYSKLITRPLIVFLAPFLAIVVYFGYIIYKLYIYDPNKPAQSQSAGYYVDKHAITAEQARTRVPPNMSGAVAIGLLFVATVMPISIAEVPFSLDDDVIGTHDAAHSDQWKATRIVAQCILLLNYALKFPILFMAEGYVREGFFRVLHGAGSTPEKVQYSGGYTDPVEAGRNKHLVAGRYSAPEHYEDNNFILYKQF